MPVVLPASRVSISLLLSSLSLLSAFLLFQVQPVISKFILPWFGGSPGVWTTCMVFFQVVLFAGYAYAHALTRLRLRTQFVVHAILVIAALACLPIAPGESWKPTGQEDPAGRILLLLLGTVGLPYFILSSTSPLVQVWFTRALPGERPWRLYALSNIGSLVALLSYPFFFEPRLDVTAQTWLWSGAFVLFAGLSLLLAWRDRGQTDTRLESNTPMDTVEPKPKIWHRLLWVLLPALASVMLLATTNHVCQDVAVVPFMWVAPLSLYLLTFILCFEHERWYVRGLWSSLALIVVFIIAAEKKMPVDVTPNYIVEVSLCFAAMFLACMLCHGELARLKPAPSRLTEFYLLMSAGGAIGGMLVSLVAPRVFVTFMEWPLGLMAIFALSAVLLMIVVWRLRPLALGLLIGLLTLGGWAQFATLKSYAEKNEEPTSVLGQFTLAVFKLQEGALEFIRKLPDTFSTGLAKVYQEDALMVVSSAVIALLVLAFILIKYWRRSGHLLTILLVLILGILGTFHLTIWTLKVEHRLERVRNFYGTVYVDEDWDTGLESFYRTLTHGGIVHGMQNLNIDLREEPVTYYGRETGIGKALDSLKDRPDARVGVVGLGAGTVGCYAQRGQSYRFYDINPDVVRLAQTQFSYLRDAERRGAQVETIIGDARLMLEREPDQQFDVLLLDAFSGDAIPVHLLTREAFQIYRRHLKPDGILAVHVTNSYLQLTPVVEKQAEALGWRTTRVLSDEDGDFDETDYVLVTQNEAFLKANPTEQPDDEKKIDVPLWTDRYHNLFQILEKE